MDACGHEHGASWASSIITSRRIATIRGKPLHAIVKRNAFYDDDNDDEDDDDEDDDGLFW